MPQAAIHVICVKNSIRAYNTLYGLTQLSCFNVWLTHISTVLFKSLACVGGAVDFQ